MSRKFLISLKMKQWKQLLIWKNYTNMELNLNLTIFISIFVQLFFGIVIIPVAAKLICNFFLPAYNRIFNFSSYFTLSIHISCDHIKHAKYEYISTSKQSYMSKIIIGNKIVNKLWFTFLKNFVMEYFRIKWLQIWIIYII